MVVTVRAGPASRRRRSFQAGRSPAPSPVRRSPLSWSRRSPPRSARTCRPWITTPPPSLPSTLPSCTPPSPGRPFSATAMVALERARPVRQAAVGRDRILVALRERLPGGHTARALPTGALRPARRNRSPPGPTWPTTGRQPKWRPGRWANLVPPAVARLAPEAQVGDDLLVPGQQHPPCAASWTAARSACRAPGTPPAPGGRSPAPCRRRASGW